MTTRVDARLVARSLDDVCILLRHLREHGTVREREEAEQRIKLHAEEAARWHRLAEGER